MDYEQKYKEALNKAQNELQCCGTLDCDAARQIFRLFPELINEDERIRKEILSVVNQFDKNTTLCGENYDYNKWIAWLEKQGDNNKWKPSKDEMDALYGLAYITNKIDDKKDKAITKLYQDLKREFFNGASYENMFPLSSIDSSINIEKQGENTYNKELSELLHKVVCKFINSPDIPYSEREEVSKKIIPYVEQLEKQGEQKPFDYENANIPQKDFAPKAEPKFKVGDWVYHEISRNTIHINKIENGLYVSDEGATISFDRQNDWRLWTIEDAKDGDVLKGYGECYILFKELKDGNLISYCDFSKSKFHSWEEVDWAFQMFDPTTEYQRINFFQKMHEAGYTWDAKTKQLNKKQS